MRMHSFTAVVQGLFLLRALAKETVVIELEASTENGCGVRCSVMVRAVDDRCDLWELSTA